MDHWNRLIRAGVSIKDGTELIVEMVGGGRIGDGNEEVRRAYIPSILLTKR